MTMQRTTPPFRADHVGSLLRPPALLEARRRHDEGTISEAELRTLEDEAIAAAVKREEETGIDVVTDGEFRRRDFRTGFVQAVDGMAMRSWEMPWRSSDGVTRLRSNAFIVTGRLRQRRRLAAGEAAYLTGLTTAPIKVTRRVTRGRAGRLRANGGHRRGCGRGNRARGRGDHRPARLPGQPGQHVDG
jgi:5-methyltetrahydropteroyltriglutamate--homocysteine methyltransferase